jgi:hypothetical protein
MPAYRQLNNHFTIHLHHAWMRPKITPAFPASANVSKCQRIQAIGKLTAGSDAIVFQS